MPEITDIINTSLETSVVPKDFKEAILVPTIKKTSLDPNHMRNFRPVSNLPYISKLLEKVVAFQLHDHLASNSLLGPMQSAYRRLHSTETALVRVHHDLLHSIDQKKVVILVLLDLKAAFDTISHDTLLTRLDQATGVRGKCLAWFRSYLADRIQSVNINGFSSKPTRLLHGVPPRVGPWTDSFYRVYVTTGRNNQRARC